MSDDQAKEQHSKRILQKQNYVKKQTKIAKAHNIEIEPGEEHRFQDHSVMDCGIPNCPICSNPRKIWKEKTIKEKSFEQTKNWIEE